MHSIEGDDAVRDMEFAEQLLRGGDFVEGVQHLGRLAIGEIVEASPWS